MCRLCEIETLNRAGEEVPEALLDAHFATRDSVVGRWIQASADAFVEKHLADLEDADAIRTSGDDR